MTSAPAPALPDERTERPPERPVHLVVIGASAGGLQALRPMVAALRRHGQSAYVLAQHLAPDQTSHLSELLGSHCALTVLEATDRAVLQADHFYISPPGRDVRVVEGHLVLDRPDPQRVSVPSIDRLFHSAAISHGQQTIGVILSGSGHDGEQGAAAIAAAGGVLLVQSLQDAVHPSMPQAVLASQPQLLCGSSTELADWLNRPAELPAELAARKSPVPASGESDEPDEPAEATFHELLDLVSRQAGIDLRQYKENTLRRQTIKRYKVLGLNSLDQYLAHVHQHPEEVLRLHQSFLISVSSFFRDPKAFAQLEKALRQLVLGKSAGTSIRAWIPACATGEEVYSIAMLISEVLGERARQYDIRVFATDIDQRALEHARAGIYRAEQLTDVNAAQRERWFVPQGSHWRVSKPLREMCVFSMHDAISNPPFINLDLISCRNLLIYLKHEQQDVLLNTFHYALVPDGLLLLGKSESTGFKSRLFETLDANHKLYRRRSTSGSVFPRSTHVGRPAALMTPTLPKQRSGALQTRPLLDAAHALLLATYAPAGVLVNANFEPLHFYGHSQHYFALPRDSVDFSVFALCRSELRSELKALGYRMLQEPHEVLHGIGTPITTEDGTPRMVRPVIRRLPSTSNGAEPAFVISFETRDDTVTTPGTASGALTTPASTLGDAELVRLRQELADTREHLQAVIEELEASNEELQSLNEEVQSSSEELQSSNEELQSSNEELTTLNDELRLKSIEAAQLNATLGNIQNSIRTALVVIDLEGKITRYNTLAVRIFGLVPNDVGQHLYGIPCHIDLPRLREQVRGVVVSGHSLVERVHQRDFHYLMQIDPYRNELGTCTGAVLTFTDVSDLHRAEEARRSFEARFRQVWEAGTEGMLVADEDSRIVLVNPSLSRMFGYPDSELIGQSVERLVPAELRGEHRGLVRDFVNGPMQARLMGRRWNIRGVRRDNTELYLQISLTTIELDGRRHVLATLTDVTERQRAATALQNSERRLRLALDASHSGIWEWHLASDTNIWSDSIWGMYGLDREQHPACFNSWLHAIHPDDRDRVAQTVTGAAAAGLAFEVEWRVHLPSGTAPRWLMARGQPQLDNQGQPQCYLGIVLDVSSRREAEEREHRSEALARELTVLQQVLESSLAGYFDWDIPAGTEYLSPTLKAMLGYQDHELENRPETWQALIFPEDLPGVWQVYQRHVQSGGAQPYYNEVRYRHKDGSTVWVICAGRVIEWGPQGEPLRLVGCHVDITRLRELEAERVRNHNLRLSTILENLGTGVYIKDLDYRYSYANRVVCQALQIEPDALIGHADEDILDEPSVALVREHDRRVIAGERLEFEESIPDPVSGTDRTYLSVKLPLRRADGTIDGLCGISTDITERKASEVRLRLAASVFTHAQEGILITDLDNRVIEVNDTFCRLTGYERAQALGVDVRELIAEPHRSELLPLICDELSYRGHWQGEVTIRRADTSTFPVMLSSSTVHDERDHRPRCHVSLFSDISAIKEHQRQLEHVAHYDPLTGLANRVLLADRLQHAMVQARRSGRHLALVYLDLDGFKAVNDTHGHDIGDRLLVALAQQLRLALRQGDTLARLGGDEFVAVLTDLATPAEYEPVVLRLLQAAAAPVRVDALEFQLSASLGVTRFPHDDADADTLLRHADQAMYQAKLAGKNRHQLFDPEHDRQTRNRWDSLQHIEQALQAREFVLHYQPKVNMRSGTLVGVEALVRWQHPERGLLPPSEFLPLIEDQPLIVQLGDWVIDTALDQLEAWQQTGLALDVSVNIAPRQLQQADFIERLQARLAARPHLPPSRLELEVLETAALDNLPVLSQTLGRLRDLGVQLALDDFGTGYSSLTYLKRLPASMLKIDQSFVRDMLIDAEDLAIVEGVIGLATTFRRSVIAEGVESAEHGELLLRLGCELAQGYGIGRPMPAHELVPWATRWRPPTAWGATRNRPLPREALPAIYAGVNLRQWIRWLEQPATERPAPPPLDDQLRRFSYWLDADGSLLFADSSELQQASQIRRQVHALATRHLNQQALGATAEPTEQDDLDQLCPALLERLRPLAERLWQATPAPPV